MSSAKPPLAAIKMVPLVSAIRCKQSDRKRMTTTKQFDDIGNRTATKAGGDENGANLRSTTYVPNRLNRYKGRSVPRAVDIMGVGLATGSVTVNGQSTYRKGEYFRKELTVTGNNADWLSIQVQGAGQSESGSVFVPPAAESFSYDADGNLLSDGRWSYGWDAENRLTNIVANTTAGPQLRILLEYDWQGRRIGKRVWNNTTATGTPILNEKYVYDGWNLIAVLNSSFSLLHSFMWGTDLSGSMQGAGGVGGLLAITDSTQGTHFAAIDGNGNVAGLVNAATGGISAQYEYGPFGEVIRATGPMAKANPFRFSTKYQDDETDLVYYGYRYYSASMGIWLSRDPIEELGFRLNNRSASFRFGKGQGYDYCFNSPVNAVDLLGLSVLEDFVEWLRTVASYLCTGSEVGAAAECSPDMAKIALIQQYKDRYMKLEGSGASAAEIEAARKLWEDAQLGVYRTAEECLKEKCKKEKCAPSSDHPNPSTPPPVTIVSESDFDCNYSTDKGGLWRHEVKYSDGVTKNSWYWLKDGVRTPYTP